MAEERNPEQSGAQGNGGPVKPGVEPVTGDGPGHRGGAGNGAPQSGTVARRTDGDLPETVLDKPSTSLHRSRASGLWIALTGSAVVLLFLLIFILQNNVPTEIRFLGLQSTLPVGVALLFAAALGILLVAIPGGLRILQLRRAARRGGSRTSR
jgi:uncharacterized integral membrane protein